MKVGNLEISNELLPAEPPQPHEQLGNSSKNSNKFNDSSQSCDVQQRDSDATNSLRNGVPFVRTHEIGRKYQSTIGCDVVSLTNTTRKFRFHTQVLSRSKDPSQKANESNGYSEDVTAAAAAPAGTTGKAATAARNTFFSSSPTTDQDQSPENSPHQLKVPQNSPLVPKRQPTTPNPMYGNS